VGDTIKTLTLLFPPPLTPSTRPQIVHITLIHSQQVTRSRGHTVLRIYNLLLLCACVHSTGLPAHVGPDERHHPGDGPGAPPAHLQGPAADR